jgi:cobyrinic acid a,c-diamide synthase
MGLMIAGMSSGSGKTTLTIGLMRALKKRGIDVAAFKAGPDYIDPMFHRLATQGASYNLPAWMVDVETLQYLYEKRSFGHDLSIVEGVMGYFDGHSFETIYGSSAQLADALGIGVVIIMDASSMALTAAALIQGLMHFHQPSQIKGVIFNKVKTQGHYELLKNAVETHLDITCYGYLKPCADVQLESRHLGLIQAQEDLEIEMKIETMAALVEDTVDLDRLYCDFKNAVDQSKIDAYDSSGSPFIQTSLKRIKDRIKDYGGLRIGYAYDDAFSFYYDENLETLREVGATLMPFSPIADCEIPVSMDALYIGGGYPEVFAQALMKNQSMRASIRNHAQSDMPIYAECGGLMYLMQTLENSDGEQYEMVGIFSGLSKMTNQLQHFGHVEATLSMTINGESVAIPYRGHEFHHSIVVSSDIEMAIAVSGKKESWQCGYHVRNVIGTYVHNHFYSNLAFLEWLTTFFSQNK